MALIIFSAVGPSRYFLIFPTEYRLKLMLLHNLATCASRQHVELNITPKFLGGSSLGKIDWSPTLIDISDILLSSSRLVMIRSSILSSFNFTKLSFIHIRMSPTQASIRDIASNLDVTSGGLSWVSPAYRWYVNPCLCIILPRGDVEIVKSTGPGLGLEEHQTTDFVLERK